MFFIFYFTKNSIAFRFLRTNIYYKIQAMFAEASHTAAHAPSSDMYADDSEGDGSGGGSVAQGDDDASFVEDCEEESEEASNIIFKKNHCPTGI